jgi:8-oxo-dGTP pyrophosphatase MutT (NUDIX family)
MSPEDEAARLEVLLDAEEPLVDREVQWPGLRLRQRTYATGPALPDVLITSIRAVVFRRGRVVVVRDRTGPPHVTPGGRREEGEDMDATLRRELLEECGWSVGKPHSFAFHHFRYLGEKPPGFAYPWRPFVQPIFVVEALAYDRSRLKRGEEIEAGSSLMSASRAMSLLPEDQQVILRAALDLGRRRPRT